MSLLAQFAPGQIHAPLPGIPMTPPPVDHPALAAQPLIGDHGSSSRSTSPPVTPADSMPPAPAADPATAGPRIAGKDLKKAVVKVAALKWCNSLGEARAQAAATGKPILWLQALGDIDIDRCA